MNRTHRTHKIRVRRPHIFHFGAYLQSIVPRMHVYVMDFSLATTHEARHKKNMRSTASHCASDTRVTQHTSCTPPVSVGDCTHYYCYSHSDGTAMEQSWQKMLRTSTTNANIGRIHFELDLCSLNSQSSSVQRCRKKKKRPKRYFLLRARLLENVSVSSIVCHNIFQKPPRHLD